MGPGLLPCSTAASPASRSSRWPAAWPLFSYRTASSAAPIRTPVPARSARRGIPASRSSPRLAGGFVYNDPLKRMPHDQIGCRLGLERHQHELLPGHLCTPERGDDWKPTGASPSTRRHAGAGRRVLLPAPLRAPNNNVEAFFSFRCGTSSSKKGRRRHAASTSNDLSSGPDAPARRPARKHPDGRPSSSHRRSSSENGRLVTKLTRSSCTRSRSTAGPSRRRTTRPVRAAGRAREAEATSSSADIAHHPCCRQHQHAHQRLYASRARRATLSSRAWCRPRTTNTRSTSRKTMPQALHSGLTRTGTARPNSRSAAGLSGLLGVRRSALEPWPELKNIRRRHIHPARHPDRRRQGAESARVPAIRRPTPDQRSSSRPDNRHPPRRGSALASRQ